MAAAIMCPRCRAHSIRVTYEEPSCLSCGWVDYTTAAESDEGHRRLTRDRLLAPRGYSVAYVGTTSKLLPMRVRVVLRPGTRGPSPICPWDGEVMEPAGGAYSHKAKGVRQVWFACLTDGHRILLFKDQLDDATGWS